MNTRTVGEMFQTRRDLLKLGGLGLLGASVDSVWPLTMAASEGAPSKTQPRGTARNVLFYDGPSQLTGDTQRIGRRNRGRPARRNRRKDLHHQRDQDDRKIFL